MEHFSIGQRVATLVQGTLTEVEIIAIREPNTIANWTSADQSKRVYKVRGTGGLARLSRKYHVRQGHQLTAIFSSKNPLETLDEPFSAAR